MSAIHHVLDVYIVNGKKKSVCCHKESDLGLLQSQLRGSKICFHLWTEAAGIFCVCPVNTSGSVWDKYCNTYQPKNLLTLKEFCWSEGMNLNTQHTEDKTCMKNLDTSFPSCPFPEIDPSSGKFSYQHHCTYPSVLCFPLSYFLLNLSRETMLGYVIIALCWVWSLCFANAHTNALTLRSLSSFLCYENQRQ